MPIPMTSQRRAQRPPRNPNNQDKPLGLGVDAHQEWERHAPVAAFIGRCDDWALRTSGLAKPFQPIKLPDFMGSRRIRVTNRAFG
jgi:hypothetical protein